MAEISYPFNADSAGGGAQMVSQAQWQYMSRMFGQDRVDYQLPPGSVDSSTLPFYAAVVNGTTVSVAAGRALVGGFYYQLTATKTVTIAANTGANPRLDLVVVRADLSTGSVNLAVVQGTPAASPKVPVLTRTYGGNWEMPLHQVNVPANSGALSLTSVMPFNMPSSVAAPWNAGPTGAVAPPGTFVYDMNNNGSDSQIEFFAGRDAWIASRHLGKSTNYTPSLFNGTYTLDAGNRKGRWRWIAPSVAQVSMEFIAFEDVGLGVSPGNWFLGATLPKPANGQIRQVLTGFLSNPGEGGGMPNAMHITAHISANSTAITLYTPSSTNLAEGLDGLRALPAGGTLYISGSYETSDFGV